jgi:hypothetical protein
MSENEDLESNNDGIDANGSLLSEVDLLHEAQKQRDRNLINQFANLHGVSPISGSEKGIMHPIKC